MSNEIVLASTSLATRLGVEKGHMIETIKAQCFRALRPEQVSDTQLAAYVQIANTLNLNPLLPGMLYAYPSGNGGITPIIGPDGIFSLLSNNPDIGGWSTKHEQIENEATCTAVIKHKRLGELTKTVFMSEWKMSNNPNWQARPRHMLEIRALKQCARQVIHGIPFDEEEHQMAEINVTPAAEAPAAAATETRPPAPARRGGAAAAKAESAKPAAAPTPKQPEAIEVETRPTPPPAIVTPVVVDPTPAPAAPVEPEANEEIPVVPMAPEIAPGVSFEGFHGKAWPLILKPTVTNVKSAKTPQGKGVLVLTINNSEGGDLVCDCATFEHVTMVEGKPTITAAWIKPGVTIEANFVAKMRQTKDGAIDYTRPPALYAEQVTQAEDSSF